MRHVNIAVIAAVLVLSFPLAPVRAQVFQNEWFEITTFVPDIYGCAGEDFLLQAKIHRVVQNMPQGGFAVHLAMQGTLNGIISGVEGQIIENISYIQPQTDNGQNRVDHSVQKTLILNGFEQGVEFKLNILFHLLTIEGEIVVSLSDVSVTCRT